MREEKREVAVPIRVEEVTLHQHGKIRYPNIPTTTEVGQTLYYTRQYVGHPNHCVMNYYTTQMNHLREPLIWQDTIEGITLETEKRERTFEVHEAGDRIYCGGLLAVFEEDTDKADVYEGELTKTAKGLNLFLIRKGGTKSLEIKDKRIRSRNLFCDFGTYVKDILPKQLAYEHPGALLTGWGKDMTYVVTNRDLAAEQTATEEELVMNDERLRPYDYKVENYAAARYRAVICEEKGKKRVQYVKKILYGLTDEEWEAAKEAHKTVRQTVAANLKEQKWEKPYFAENLTRLEFTGQDRTYDLVRETRYDITRKDTGKEFEIIAEPTTAEVHMIKDEKFITKSEEIISLDELKRTSFVNYSDRHESADGLRTEREPIEYETTFYRAVTASGTYVVEHTHCKTWDTEQRLREPTTGHGLTAEVIEPEPPNTTVQVPRETNGTEAPEQARRGLKP